MTFADLRKSKGMTQTELGGLLDVSQQAVNHWETGHNPPLRKYHAKLRSIFELTQEELELVIANSK